MFFNAKKFILTRIGCRSRSNTLNLKISYCQIWKQLQRECWRQLWFDDKNLYYSKKPIGCTVLLRCHLTYPDSLNWNGSKKTYAFKRRLFELFSPVHTITVKRWKYNSLRFRPSTRSLQAGIFLKKLHSRDRFWKPAFFVPENALYVRKAKTEKKISVFKNIGISVDGD